MPGRKFLLLIFLLSFVGCLSFHQPSPPQYDGILMVGGGRGIPEQPDTAPPFRPTDPELADIGLDKMVAHEPTGKFRDHSVYIEAALHMWTQGATVYRSSNVRISERKADKLHWDTSGVLNDSFRRLEFPDKADLHLQLDVVTVKMLRADEQSMFIVHELLGALTLLIYPARTVTDRMQIQLKLSDKSGRELCNRNVAFDIMYRFSILFALVPPLWDFPSQLTPMENGQLPPFYTKERINRIATFLLDSCPTPQ